MRDIIIGVVIIAFLYAAFVFILCCTFKEITDMIDSWRRKKK